MGLLGNLLKKTGSSDSVDQTAVSSVLDLINHNQVGGLDGLVSKMTQGGLGNIIGSWIGTGKNQSINAGQLSKVLGNDIIGQFASKLGISNAAAATKLAGLLPKIVDKLTPDGKVTASNQTVNVQDLLGRLLKK